LKKQKLLQLNCSGSAKSAERNADIFIIERDSIENVTLHKNDDIEQKLRTKCSKLMPVPVRSSIHGFYKSEKQDKLVRKE